MPSFTLSIEPPKNWDAVCAEHHNLFHSTRWQSLLHRSFNSQTIYVWDNKGDDGIAITIFKAGPFWIGYVGFPVGSTIKGSCYNQEKVESLIREKFIKPLHLLRIPMSHFLTHNKLNYSKSETPETAITDLQNWQTKNLRKTLRSDIRKAMSFNTYIVDASLSSQGDVLYYLYKETVLRHRGSIRYNTRYFRELIDFSHNNDNLRCLLAILNNDIISFFVAALHGNTGYYLHGADNIEMRQYRATDLLFEKAINWAKNKGMDTFNFMSSPPDQPTLVFLKEKWGGVTRTHYTYNVPINKVYAYFFSLFSAIHKKIPRRG